MTDKPLTPNLKDNEFEVVVHCPVGECPANLAWAYDKQYENDSFIADAKKLMKSKAKQQHSRGEHIARAK